MYMTIKNRLEKLQRRLAWERERKIERPVEAKAITSNPMRLLPAPLKVGDRVFVDRVSAHTIGDRNFHEWSSEATIDMIKDGCMRVTKGPTIAWIYPDDGYDHLNNAWDKLRRVYAP